MERFLVGFASLLPFAAFLTGCEASPNEAGPPVQVAKTGPKALVFDVSDRVNAGHLFVTVRTNLPDGTEVGASLDSENFGNGRAQDHGAVEAGQVKLGPFSRKGDALPIGKYELSVSAPLVSVQPANLRNALGTDYSNFKSPLIRKQSRLDGLSGSIIEYHKSVAIGSH